MTSIRGAGRVAGGAQPLPGDSGTTLIETLVAVGLLAVAVSGLLGLVALSSTYTENQGHLSARATEYAEDKMEQLLSLAYGDSTSDTTVFPSSAAGGTGLTVGGSASPSAPASGYVDWLNANGDLLAVNGTTAPTGWFYKRVWSITSPSANLKQVTVTTVVSFAVGNMQPPQSTVTALKTSPF